MTSTSLVDDRTQHEVYAHPFLRSVQAGVASAMCSYSEYDLKIRPNFTNSPIDIINETYACENDQLINGVLKGELGFQGYIMTDWGAKYSTEAAMAGLDVSASVSISFIVLDSLINIDGNARRRHSTFKWKFLRSESHQLCPKWYYPGVSR